MDNILYHTNHPAVSTFNTNLTAGCVNPLRRVSYKQQININSRFRNNYTTTPASDFYFTMATPIKKVVAMKLVCINLPNMIYTINPKTGSNNFWISEQGVGSKRVYVPSGSYTGSQLATLITDLMQSTSPFGAGPAFPTIKLSYDKITGKMTFEKSGGGSFDISFDYIPPCNDIDHPGLTPALPNFCPPGFCQNDYIYGQVGSNVFKDQMTLGWILGFRQNYKYNTPINAVTQDVTNKLQINSNSGYVSRKELRNLHNIRNRPARLTEVKNNGQQYLETNYNCCDASGFMMYPSPLDINYTYTGKNKYTGEGIYDPLGNRYFLLSVNDYQNNHSLPVVSPMQEETLTDGHILAIVPAGCCAKSCENEERIYFGPTDITRLHIKLLDEFGRVVDLNNGDYSFTLELEVLYDL